MVVGSSAVGRSMAAVERAAGTIHRRKEFFGPAATSGRPMRPAPDREHPRPCRPRACSAAARSRARTSTRDAGAQLARVQRRRQPRGGQRGSAHPGRMFGRQTMATWTSGRRAEARAGRRPVAGSHPLDPSRCWAWSPQAGATGRPVGMPHFGQQVCEVPTPLDPVMSPTLRSTREIDRSVTGERVGEIG
jgi:hypothetical protein